MEGGSFYLYFSTELSGPQKDSHGFYFGDFTMTCTCSVGVLTGGIIGQIIRWFLTFRCLYSKISIVEPFLEWPDTLADILITGIVFEIRPSFAAGLLHEAGF